MNNTDLLDEALGFYTRIDSRLGGIALSYLATAEKIYEVSKAEWQDESLARFENKMRMKELGGAVFRYAEFLHENSILALAKAIEDTSIELKRFLNFKFDSVREHHDVIFVKEAKLIRALSNVIKHNVSHLERDTSESAKFLVDECGMNNGYTLAAFIHSGHEAFNIIEYVPKVYLALLDLVHKSTGHRHPYLDFNLNEAFNKVYEKLIPDVVNLVRPNKSLRPAGSGGS